MRASFAALLGAASRHGCAVAAVNVYSLDQAAGVLQGAADVDAPVMLQVHPAVVELLGLSIVAGLRQAADDAPVPAIVHLDHWRDAPLMERALRAGADSVMADGATLPFEQNVALVRAAIDAAGAACVEAELGILSGTEDRAATEDVAASMTDPGEAKRFVADCRPAALAICIGNVHGQSATQPRLDFGRLRGIAAEVDTPLVLHGASGLAEATISRCVELGIRKVNFNTDIRAGYVDGLVTAAEGEGRAELVEMMEAAQASVRRRTVHAIEMLGSGGLASRIEG